MKKLFICFFMLVALLPAPTKAASSYTPMGTNEFIVTPTTLRQVNQGWGVSLCWWPNMCGKWSDDKIDQLVDWLVSPTGLNYNVFRYNIGGGDDPLNRHCDAHHMANGKGLRAEMEGFKDSTNGNYIWTRDSAQRKIMLKIKQRRPDAVFEAFSNSAPYYMTYSGCVAGNDNASKDNLKPEYYTEFAHYLVDVCKHYKDAYGIEFKTLEPFNEPSSSYWGRNGGQEGCHFDYSSQIAFLKVLKPILDASGLKTVISCSDETAVSASIGGFQAYQKAGVMDMVAQWNTHTYSGNNKQRVNIGDLARHAGKMLWMSEVGSGGDGFKGNLQLAQHLFNDVKYIRPDVWTDWQYVEEYGDQWCMVRGNFSDQTYEKVNSYYVHQQITRFIKQGYTYVDALNDDALAAVNPTRDTLVLVTLNLADTARTLTARLDGTDVTASGITGYFSNGGYALANFKVASTQPYSASRHYSSVTYKMPKLSIVTLVIPISIKQPQASPFVQGTTCLVVPAANHTEALTVADGKLCIQPATASSAQLWQFKPVDDSEYLLQNADSEYVAAADNYYLNVTNSEMEAQQIAADTNSVFTWRLLTGDDMAFDLEKESLSAGTRVGEWAFGSIGSAAHRTWLLLPIATGSTSAGISSLHGSNANAAARYYNLQGIRLTRPTRGITIVRTADGKAHKIKM